MRIEGDRVEAIRLAVRKTGTNDVLVSAGRGYETKRGVGRDRRLPAVGRAVARHGIGERGTVRGRFALHLVLASLALASCSKSSEDGAPSQAAAAAIKSTLRAKARADVEERKRVTRTADEEAIRFALADEAELEAKARMADQNTNAFRGRTVEQLKQSARRECRVGKCEADVLGRIFEAARPEDSETVRCVVRFEEDSWSCRQGINPALCDPPACR
jgi:hypothetical protein